MGFDCIVYTLNYCYENQELNCHTALNSLVVFNWRLHDLITSLTEDDALMLAKETLKLEILLETYLFLQVEGQQSWVTGRGNQWSLTQLLGESQESQPGLEMTLGRPDCEVPPEILCWGHALPCIGVKVKN